MNRLKELRDEKKLSLEELSKEIDIPKTSLSNYERGKREPKIDVWKQIADYFKVPVAYLMGLTDTKELEADIYKNGSLIKNDLIKRGNGGYISPIEIAKKSKKNSERIKELENFLKKYLDRDPTESEVFGVSSFLNLDSEELKSSIVDVLQNINLIDVLHKNTVEGLENVIKELETKINK